MRRCLTVLVVLAACALSNRAQSPLPHFNAATVTRSDRGGRTYKFEEHRFLARNDSLYTLIAIAYDLPVMGAIRISGGAGWTRQDHYTVEGTVELPADTTPRERAARMRLMLCALLADRFKLVLRTETKDIPIYELTVGKRGLKLKPSKLSEEYCAGAPLPACHLVSGGPAVGLHAKAATIADVARAVCLFSTRTVIDKTGLPGLYEIDTDRWADTHPVPGPVTNDSAIEAASVPALSTVFENLGLKMDSTRGPVKIYVIERAERP